MSDSDAYLLGYREGWEEALVEMLALLVMPDMTPVKAYQELSQKAVEALQRKADGHAPSWRKLQEV